METKNITEQPNSDTGQINQTTSFKKRSMFQRFLDMIGVTRIINLFKSKKKKDIQVQVKSNENNQIVQITEQQSARQQDAQQQNVQQQNAQDTNKSKDPQQLKKFITGAQKIFSDFSGNEKKIYLT